MARMDCFVVTETDRVELFDSPKQAKARFEELIRKDSSRPISWGIKISAEGGEEE